MTKAGDKCTKAVAALPKLETGFAATIAKACGAAPLAVTDLLTADGLGVAALDDTCTALGVASLTTVADVSTCLERQLACRADQMLENETPRLTELLNAIGTTLP